MAEINEELIKKVFHEMAKYRPGLARHVMMDDEDEDEVDYRVLGDQIIKNYPWPIGVELRRLFSAGMRKLNRLPTPGELSTCSGSPPSRPIRR